MAKKTGKELYEKEKNLADYQGVDRIVSSHELAKQVEKIADLEKIPTGVPSLDRLHEGGFEPGELVITTGYTGEGKTALLMSITSNMADKEIPTAWFTMEVTPRQFIKKISKRTDNIPLFYLPNENTENQIQWVEDRIAEAKAKHNVRAVFIDHIHRIFSMYKMRNTSSVSLEIGDLVGKIKSIALDYGVVVFLIAHCRDAPDSNPNREPSKEMIRDSGLISREADSIVGIWRVPNDDKIENTRRKPLEEDDNKAKVAVFKNRREGRHGRWFMRHDSHYLIEEYETDDDFDNF